MSEILAEINSLNAKGTCSDKPITPISQKVSKEPTYPVSMSKPQN